MFFHFVYTDSKCVIKCRYDKHFIAKVFFPASGIALENQVELKNLSPVKIPLLLLILLISVGCSFLGSQFSPTNTPLPPFERPERTFTKTPEILSTKVELTPTSTFAPMIVTDFVETWPDSTPEEQGMDSANLAALLQKIQKENLNIHSILVARHGFLVLEAYFPPFERETPHNLYSCTKSVTSAAFGIAFQNGLIDSLDTPVQTFFPDLSLDSEQKKGITLRHLLTMSSGIEWIEPLRSGLSDSWSLYDANSPVQYFFDRAMAAEPGKQFNYNSGGSHLLSMVIENTAGESTDTYTSRELFLPLGISRYSWQKDPQGYTIGGIGLAMTSSDMLKFGQLYLNMGTWKGQSLFSPEWVKDSTRAHIAVSPGIDYGYQWWVRPNGIYNALGWGGQQIIVVPHQDMVIVFTAGIRDASWNTYDDLINGYLLPAVKSAKPISANQEAFGLLQDQISAIANPFPQSLPPCRRLLPRSTVKHSLT